MYAQVHVYVQVPINVYENVQVQVCEPMFVCLYVCSFVHAGADPGFFPRGGPVGHSATKTPQASQGKVWRGVWNMKCSKSDSEQTSGTLEIFSRAIF